VKVSKEPRSGFRFPRTAKLLKHSDFQRVYKSGKRHFSGLMTVFYFPRPDVEALGPRVGITVSRALGGAVERNRIKRRMREAIRFHLSGLTGSMDIVMNPKKAVADTDFTALEQEVVRAFEVIEKASSRMQPAKERSTAP
jgi:ribonuclease P protein component